MHNLWHRDWCMCKVNLHVRQSILCAMCLSFFIFVYIVNIFLWTWKKETGLRCSYASTMPNPRLPSYASQGWQRPWPIDNWFHMQAFLYSRALVGLIAIDCPCSQITFSPPLFIPFCFFCFHRCGGRTAEKSRLTLIDGKITQKKKTAQLASRAEF